MPERPGGMLAKRPLQFIWIVDCSGSMIGRKIDSLNLAIREAIKPSKARRRTSAGYYRSLFGSEPPLMSSSGRLSLCQTL